MKRLLFFTLLAFFVLIPWALHSKSAVAASPDGLANVSFTEIAPVEGNAQNPAWVELSVNATLTAPHTLYLPIVYGDTTGEPSGSPAVLRGTMANLSTWHLTDQDAHRYDFPDGLHVPQGTLILIYFGTGTDELDGSDGRITLYADDWGTQPFAPEGDDLTLYNQESPSPSAVADYIAWGQSPEADAQDAIEAGKWDAEDFHFFDSGFGAEGVASPPMPNDALGYWEGTWFPYYTNSTPGTPNLPPLPSEMLTPDGTILERETFGLGWSPLAIEGVAYDFQLALSPTFDVPLVDTTLTHSGWAPATPLTDGQYYWRARLHLADGRTGAWWGPFGVESRTLDFSAGILRTTMGSEFYQIQHKDTYLLEIGGAPKNRYWDEKAGIYKYRGLWREELLNGMPSQRNVWDAPHIFPNGMRSFSNNSFDNFYCARASASMLNHYYGGNLSQDRISYHLFEELSTDSYANRPEGDFGYATGASTTKATEFALGIDMEAHNFCPAPDNTYNPDKKVRCAISPVPAEPVTITWAEVVNELDKGEPLVFSSGGHAFIITGYWEYQGQQWFQLFDPAPKDCKEEKCGSPTWRRFDELEHYLITYLTIPEGVTPDPRNDEPSIHQDSDDDGMMDFDELYRFDTNRFVLDTDQDWLNDKQEVASYTFLANGTYARPWGPDYDHAGDRMELDWDNDNDAVADGCEDRNGNGYYDSNAGESSNFNPNDDNLCIPRLRFVQPSTAAPAPAGTFVAPNPINVVFHVRYPTPMGTPNYQQSAFAVTIGGIPATVLTKNQAGTTVTLNVRPPVQASPGLYDIVATYNSPAGVVSDSAADAVRYDPVPQ